MNVPTGAQHMQKNNKEKKTNRNIHVSLSLYPETNVIIYIVNQEKNKKIKQKKNTDH